jgi:hypothetical protein
MHLRTTNPIESSSQPCAATDYLKVLSELVEKTANGVIKLATASWTIWQGSQGRIGTSRRQQSGVAI